MVKYSIIIPIYNAESYLRNTLDSILKQRFTDYEVILVNDGSKDNSLNICNEYKEKHSNFKVITIENSGSGIARNTGIKEAKGEFLYFPDADDVLTEDALEKIDMVISSKKSDLYVFAFYKAYRDSDELILEKYEDNFLESDDVRSHYEMYMERNGIYIQGAPWNKVFRREIVTKNGVEFPSLKRHQDEAFIVRYMAHTRNVLISKEPIYIYYLNRLYEESLKFPKNYYEIKTDLYNLFMDVTKSWSKGNNIELYLKYNFVMTCNRLFELIFSKKWSLNKKERMLYIKNILNDKLMEENINYVILHENEVISMLKRQKYSDSKIERFIKYIKMLNKKNYKLIYLYSNFYVKYKKIRGR